MCYFWHIICKSYSHARKSEYNFKKNARRISCKYNCKIYPN